MNNITSPASVGDNQQNQQVLNLSDILLILLRRKYTLLISIVSLLLFALLYNFLAEPVYQTTVLLKKEKQERETYGDDISNILQLRSPDEIETEMEILKARSVLEKVVDELKLNVFVSEIIFPDGSSRKYELSLAEYQTLNDTSAINGPQVDFSDIRTSQNFEEKNLHVRITGENLIELYDEKNKLPLKTLKNTPDTRFVFPDFQFTVNCSQMQPGIHIIFQILNSAHVVKQLEESISVEAIRKTSLFRMSYKATSPYMAQLVANTIADKFRQVRLELKQQTIRYSFNFVDQQLEEVSQKLKAAELELRNFKSEHQFLEISDASHEILTFMTNLEAEKVKTGLELAQYRSRYAALSGELKTKGYFDQTYLTPSQTQGENNPFAILLRQLSDAELQRLTLLEKRTGNHPDVQALERRITEIKSNLSQYNQNTITSYEIIINSLQKKQRDIENLIAQYMKRIRKFPEQENILMELIRQKEVHEKMFVLLLDKREEMRMSELSKLQDIVIVEPAAMPLKPIQPRKRLNLAIGFFVGLMVGLTNIFVQEFFTKKIRTLTEIEDELNMPILAILPKFPAAVRKKIDEWFILDHHISLLTDSQFGFKESYRVMQAKLSTMRGDRNIIIFTSCEENSGKTTVVTNFAVSLALSGKKVFIVECDLRKPKIAEFFNLRKDSPGVVDFLKNGSSSPPIYNSLNEYGISNVVLDVMPAGKHGEDMAILLESPRLKNFLQEISSNYDYVFIDTSPMTRTADVFLLGSFLKDIILVVHPDLTIKESLIWALRSMKQFEMNILGCVINGCELKNLTDRYRYGYGYSYGYDYMDESIKGLPPPSKH